MPLVDVARDFSTPTLYQIFYYAFTSVLIRYFRCAACKESAPVWEELATAFADNKKFVIAETQCDDSNDLCDYNDVESYPSYKYG